MTKLTLPVSESFRNGASTCALLPAATTPSTQAAELVSVSHVPPPVRWIVILVTVLRAGVPQLVQCRNTTNIASLNPSSARQFHWPVWLQAETRSRTLLYARYGSMGGSANAGTTDA